MSDIVFNFIWCGEPGNEMCTMRTDMQSPCSSRVQVVGYGKTKKAALKDLKRRSLELSKAIKQAAKAVTL